jgi:hypothetical protein
MSLYYISLSVSVSPRNLSSDSDLSSSPRRLSISSFSKALVGEHRSLSFLYGMAMMLILESALQPSHAHCIYSFSTYKYFRTCALTRLSLFLLSRHTLHPLLCLSRFQFDYFQFHHLKIDHFDHFPSARNLPNILWFNSKSDHMDYRPRANVYVLLLHVVHGLHPHLPHGPHLRVPEGKCSKFC